MKRPVAILLASLLTALTLHAEPLVVGFERFHKDAPTAEGGRLLFNELGCANCHGGDTGLPARRGPELSGVTRRVQAAWLRKFLASPSAAHTGSAMPQLLATDKPGDIDAVLNYLGSLKPESTAKAKAMGDVNAPRGGELFHSLGCVACHAPQADFTPPEGGAPKDSDFTYRAAGFPNLGEKWVLSSLAAFIADPLKVRPDGRMPRTAMEVADAVDIAAYLLHYESSVGKAAPGVEVFQADKAQAERGRTIVAAARCSACHQLPSEVAAQPVALKRQEGGCLDAKTTAGVPHYELAENQRAALKLFLAQREKAATPAQLTMLTLEALNCVACHERDGRGGPGAARQAYFLGDPSLGDTGRYPPPLTGVGRKLQPEWLVKVLTGEYRVRPYLHTKMPVYGTATAGLGAMLSATDAKKESALTGGDDTAGRKLMGTQGGIGCITCHRWGQHPSIGIQALDLSNLGQRIQPGWLREYLINPAGYRPGTLMPSFWPEGKAANGEILGGNTDRQIASIYSFAASANGEPEGFPALGSSEFELVPKDRPIVQRTFMEGAGTHAILVGFPTGVHLAYDGKNARPALAWKGKFFDAYNTWFSRFAPFEKPPGEAIVAWQPAPPSEAKRRFAGYRLDSQGVPTFLFSIDGVAVEERIEGIENGLRRTVTWNASAPESPAITHPAGVSVAEGPGSAAGHRVFTYLWK
ncbi:MAG: c-type cytochrome [Chthoniobacter sp.]|uniref:c-type cytochrome n=1 Tax=Chthoniobacter sp. TaxID=2510640 RepID=UPI0032A98722